MKKLFLAVLALLGAPILYAQPTYQIELTCPAGTSPIMPAGQTLNSSTGKYRQWLCVDPLGNVFDSSAVSPVSSNPICPASGFYLYFNTNTGQLLQCNSGTLSTVTGYPSTVFDTTLYGAQFKVRRTCLANFTNTSQTVTTNANEPPFQCPGGNFPCSAGGDVGAIEFGTNAFCAGQYGNNSGVVIVPQGTITNIANAHSATVSIAATQTCTSSGSTSCQFAWGLTDDTTAIQSAFTALNAVGGTHCGTLVMPSGNAFVSSAIGVTTSQCGVLPAQNSSGTFDGYTVGGQSMYGTTLIPLPSFDAATCTTFNNICFFNTGSIGGQVDLHDFTINGLGNATVTNGNGHWILAAHETSTVENVGITEWGNNTSGFGAINASGVVGGFTFLKNVNIWNGGYNPGVFGPWLDIIGSQLITYTGTNVSGVINGYGNQWLNDAGGGTLLVSTGSVVNLYGDQIGANGVSQSGISFTGAATVNLFGVNETSTGGLTNGIITNGNAATVHFSCGNKISGSTAAVTGTGGTFFNDCPGGNTFTGTVTPMVPTCTFTTGGGTAPSCALQAGSTNEKGVVIATTGTGAPGTTGTVTLTFAGTFSGATGTTPACTYTIDNSGTAWGNEAGIQVSTQSTTAPIFAWFNLSSGTLTALTVSSPYRVDYNCSAR